MCAAKKPVRGVRAGARWSTDGPVRLATDKLVHRLYSGPLNGADRKLAITVWCKYVYVYDAAPVAANITCWLCLESTKRWLR